ncbi:MAG TPA: hypothetical protein VNT81_22265 [Vicinamibacterales bacterium]|nr:hypothetical protein [Vicinamibacterales bacterium]
MRLVWQRTISVAVLSLLATLPVSGPVCAVLCAPPAQDEYATAGHHDQHADHDQHASVPPDRESHVNQAAMGAPPHQNCSSHQALGDVTAASLSAVRADVGLITAVQHVLPMAAYLSRPMPLRVYSGSSPPLDTPSPTCAPLVLRI